MSFVIKKSINNKITKVISKSNNHAPVVEIVGLDASNIKTGKDGQTILDHINDSKIHLTEDKIVEIIKEHKDIVDISEANVLVAGGRGIGSEENFKMLKELAEVMNGSIAASRAAVEKGWVDKDYQVGQTGKTVRPNIYVACGISGAIQHAAGMQDSDMIIAINKDANAPIMKIADYAIVGDVNKVVPEFIAQLKAMKEEA